MLNSHCNNNDKKKHKKTYGFKDHHGIHYAMEADKLIDKNNQYMLKL